MDTATVINRPRISEKQKRRAEEAYQYRFFDPLMRAIQKGRKVPMKILGINRTIQEFDHEVRMFDIVEDWYISNFKMYEIMIRYTFNNLTFKNCWFCGCDFTNCDLSLCKMEQVYFLGRNKGLKECVVNGLALKNVYFSSDKEYDAFIHPATLAEKEMKRQFKTREETDWLEQLVSHKVSKSDLPQKEHGNFTGWTELQIDTGKK